MNTETEVMVDAEMKIRWGIKRDLDEVLTIENECFEYPWSDDDFSKVLRRRNCIIRVAEVAECVAAYAIYELNPRNLRLLNFAVRADLQRKGIGSELLANIKSKLSQSRRPVLVADVRETNLGAQLFFRSQGFKATAIVASPYRDNNEDAYEFRYVVRVAECTGR
jgi:ribosomal-protein-alanine N-acetyltransferase